MKSYVISVSLMKGCYRHILVPRDYTLEELSDAILVAFGFEDDHAHAFFMDDRAWSSADCYYADYVDEEGELRHTSDYRLSDVLTMKGQKFKYLFDFGDEWVFQCKLLREDDEPTEAALLLRAVGEAPSQYGDDDWDEEE